MDNSSTGKKTCLSRSQEDVKESWIVKSVMEGTIKNTIKNTNTEVTSFNNTIYHLESCLIFSTI